VIAKSFERIPPLEPRRDGRPPLQFEAGQDAASLGLNGQETFSVAGVAKTSPEEEADRHGNGHGGQEEAFTVTCRLDTPNEVDYYRHGGILHFVLRQLAAA